ncbi:hypothetical protein [Deinococcus irradiatisoli]|uniref:hypothetical protein n=1 Tax=Deinococcus irradiatisoli TaxID=2202254 RepID=UPI001FE66A80|nr:hypothetical protein [Deinococcus irradiatisoli]
MVVDVSHDTVTLSRDQVGGKISATINGEAADLARADRLLRTADRRTLTAEVLAPLPTIGKARAGELHKIMARLGLPHAQHYALAAAALCEPFALDSLAGLTEQEARTVWRHVCRMYPSAVRVAA